MKKNRDSNFELLRIIFMFFIVLYHTILHGNILTNSTGVSNYIFYFIMFLIISHVNLFMLITGYYQVNAKFKLKKIISLLAQIGFYNIIINTILYVSGLVEYNNVSFVKSIMFFKTNDYWFVECYIIVYLLSPFFNKFINSCDRTTLKKLIIVLIMSFAFIPFFTGGLFHYSSNLTVSQYIIMYFIGAYIRKYNLDSKILSSISITQKRAVLIVIFITCVIFNVSLYYLSKFFSSLDSNIFRELASQINIYKFNYGNPIIVLQSLSIFLLFSTFSFKSKIINSISSLTLGVYLIHENGNIRANIYKWLWIDPGEAIYGKSIIAKVLVVACIIFITCLLIEFLRKIIFKLLSRNKYINNICTNINSYMDRLTLVK